MNGMPSQYGYQRSGTRTVNKSTIEESAILFFDLPLTRSVVKASVQEQCMASPSASSGELEP
jgi:hypothetical protein